MKPIPGSIKPKNWETVMTIALQEVIRRLQTLERDIVYKKDI